MTWTNDNGLRMRTWIKEETEVGDPQDFMDQLVDRIVTIVTTEPIDIYVNPTFFPDEINDRYDEFWTEERIDRVVAALVESRCGPGDQQWKADPQSGIFEKGQSGRGEIYLRYQQCHC